MGSCSLWFSFKRHLYHIASLLWCLDVNSVKTDFWRLSSLFRIHAVLKLAPVFSQNSEEMHLVHIFCSPTAKTSTVTPISFFMILIRTVLPFNEKKIGMNLRSVFLAMLLNCTDWAITGRIARVQITSTLERQVKNKGIKRHSFWYLSG